MIRLFELEHWKSIGHDARKSHDTHRARNTDTFTQQRSSSSGPSASQPTTERYTLTHRERKEAVQLPRSSPHAAEVSRCGPANTPSFLTCDGLPAGRRCTESSVNGDGSVEDTHSSCSGTSTRLGWLPNVAKLTLPEFKNLTKLALGKPRTLTFMFEC